MCVLDTKKRLHVVLISAVVSHTVGDLDRLAGMISSSGADSNG